MFRFFLSKHSHTSLKVLLIGAFLLRIALLVRPPELFHARPFIEDAYYSLSAARSLGHGAGLTVDGVHPTNGIQPLIVFLYAPFFSFFDDENALRCCLLLDIVIEFLLVFACFRYITLLTKDGFETASAAVTAALILLWTQATSVYTLNGLETGLAAALAVLALTKYQTMLQRGITRIMDMTALGVLLGITILARIDAAFLAAVISLHYLFTKNSDRPFLTRSFHVLLLACACLFFCAPWFAYNYLFFGNVVPTSGLSQSIVVPYTANLAALLQLFASAFLVVVNVPYNPALTPLSIAVSACALLASAILAATKLRPVIITFLKNCFLNRDARFFILPSMFISALILYYCFAFGAPHFLTRYLFIFHVFFVIAFSIVCAGFFSILRMKNSTLHRFVRNIAVLCVVLMYLFSYAWNFQSSKAKQNDFLQISEWIGAHVSSSERVGMGQSGTAGFFNPTVTNLDGKVNHAVFEALRGKRFCNYLDSARFDYLIDWRHFFDVVAPCGIPNRYEHVWTVGRFLVYRRLSEKEKP